MRLNRTRLAYTLASGIAVAGIAAGVAVAQPSSTTPAPQPNTQVARTALASSTIDPAGPNVEQGGPDTGVSAVESTGDQTVEATNLSDGPGGHQDNPANANVDFQGEQ
jgi:hypothetical protein